MDQHQQRLNGEFSELRRVELNACRLPLALPGLIVGAKYAVPEQVSDRVSKVGSFGEVREFTLEEMLYVARIRSDHTVEAAKPRTLKHKRPIPTAKNAGNPFIHVGPETPNKRRQHPKKRPNRQAMALPLP